MAYGSAAGVAALCKRYTTAGAFDTTTNPTLSTVGGWLSQVSAMMDVALATSGFATPITDADITPALDGFINAMVADLVHAANSAGRFFSERSLEFGVSPIKAINNDVRAWVEDMAPGLTALGASRSNPARGVSVVCSVSNPTYERTISDAATSSDVFGDVI